VERWKAMRGKCSVGPLFYTGALFTGRPQSLILSLRRRFGSIDLGKVELEMKGEYSRLGVELVLLSRLERDKEEGLTFSCLHGERRPI